VRVEVDFVARIDRRPGGNRSRRTDVLVGVRRIAVVALLLVAACGSDDDASQGSELPPETGAPASSSPQLRPGVRGVGAGVERSPVDPAAPVSELAAGFNDAGFALWRTQPVDANVVFSPASIGHAMLMARAAADETTGAAIDAAFQLPDGTGAHGAWNAIDQQIRQAQSADVTVTMADRIWPRVDVQPDQAWIDLLVAEHGADVETLDFTADPAGSRDVINGWVSDQTRGLIPELLPDGFIKPAWTVLVLTDAVYFAADWQTPFGKYPAVPGTFTTLDGTTKPVEFMRELELGDPRGVGDGFAAAEIPYAGGEYSMLVIVPDADRFTEIRDRLGPGLLDEMDSTFTSGPYELLLPKWEAEHQIDLLDWLGSVGAAPGAYPAIDPAAALTPRSTPPTSPWTSTARSPPRPLAWGSRYLVRLSRSSRSLPTSRSCI